VIIDNDVGNGSFSYLIGMEVDDSDQIGKECVKITIPSAHYAVFNTPPADTGTFVRNIHKTWHYIYQVWLPQTGFVHMGTHEFETYCEASYSFSEEIWIPLAK
jgi:AraC family transcriptional regulator